MYSGVEIKGHQYKVEIGDIIDVDKIEAEVNDSLTFDRVLFSNGTIGTPTVSGVNVVAKVVRQGRSRKEIVLTRKPGKYVKKNGHRTHYTCLEITSIGGSTAKPKKEKAKPAPKKKAAPKKAVADTPKSDAKDDLKKVEGIGPKIAEILNNNGVMTWAQLADTSVETIQTWLEAAGPRYKSKNPGSWPKQAKMAAEGKWEELEKWQDEHDHGIEK